MSKDSLSSRQSGSQIKSVANHTSHAAKSLPAVPIISDQKEEGEKENETLQLRSVQSGAGGDAPAAFRGNTSGINSNAASETPLTQFKAEDSGNISPETTATPFSLVQKKSDDQVTQLVLGEWGSWALEQVSGVVVGAMKKGLGVDPVEIAAQLRATATADVSIYTKVVYLATYGSYAASEFLKDNYADIIGGDAGALIEETDELNSQLEEASDLWEEGEVTPEMLNDSIREQVINRITGGGGDG